VSRQYIDIVNEIIHYYLMNQTISVTLRKFQRYNLHEKDDHLNKVMKSVKNLSRLILVDKFFS